MIAPPQHEIKPADAVLAEDVICQSFIQSSCTLAYACLLIRRRRFELAAHVLHSLEAKQASRFKDMVFYLQAQIGIETGEYAMVKKRLVPRVHQHPNDLVALSLLECCIHREFAEKGEGVPVHTAPSAAGPFGNAEAASASALASALAATELPAAGAPVPAPPARTPAAPVPGAVQARPAAPAASEGPRTQSTPVVPAAAAPAAQPELVEISLANLPPASAPAAGREGSRGHRSGASGDADLGVYQGIAQDPNTLALGAWGSRGRAKTFCRAPELEPLMAALPRELPGALQAACTALEGGPIHKICFSFQHLTISTFHAGTEGMALATGPLNQSLLAIVRAENTFKKAGLASGGPASAGGSSAGAAAPGAGA